MTSPAYQALAKQAAAVRSDPNSWKTAPPPSSTSSNNNPGPRVEISRQFMESVSRAYPHVPLQILIEEIVKVATLNPDGKVFMNGQEWSNALNSAINQSTPKPGTGNSYNNQSLPMSPFSSMPNVNTRDVVQGMADSIDDNLTDGFIKWAIHKLTGYDARYVYTDEYSYYLGTRDIQETKGASWNRPSCCK